MSPDTLRVNRRGAKSAEDKRRQKTKTKHARGVTKWIFIIVVLRLKISTLLWWPDEVLLKLEKPWVENYYIFNAKHFHL